jgi:hypothetical protein
VDLVDLVIVVLVQQGSTTLAYMPWKQALGAHRVRPRTRI